MNDLNNNFSSRTKLECLRCRKIKNIKQGELGSWFSGNKSFEMKFACFSCIRKIEKEEKEAKATKWKSLIQSLTTDPSIECSNILKENKIMLEVLNKMCPTDGWYKLKDIAKEFRLKARWTIGDNRVISNILNRLKFTQRKRLKHGSYVHVYINTAVFHHTEG